MRSSESGAAGQVVVTVVRGSTQVVSRAFKAGQPCPAISVGSNGDWIVTAPGVMPIHLWLNFDGRRLHARSAAGSAQLQDELLSDSWNPVPEDAELRFGFALMRIDRQQPGHAAAAGGLERPRRSWVKYVALAVLLGLCAIIGLTAPWRREVEPAPPVAVSASPSAAPTAVDRIVEAGEVRGREPSAALPPPPVEEFGTPATAVDELAEPSSALRARRAYRRDVADRPVPRIGAQPDQISEEWLAHHQRLLLAGNRATARVIFLGDSITEGWVASAAYREHFGKYAPINLGLAGDLSQNVLWRIEQGALDGTKPQVVVVMVGINNLAGGFSAQQTAGGVRAVVESVLAHLPGARVLLLAILPARQDPANPLRQRIQETNRLLLDLAKPGRVEVRDFGSLLLEPDGSISKTILRDFLHPTPTGYERISQAVAPVLDAALKSASN